MKPYQPICLFLGIVIILSGCSSTEQPNRTNQSVEATQPVKITQPIKTNPIVQDIPMPDIYFGIQDTQDTQNMVVALKPPVNFEIANLFTPKGAYEAKLETNNYFPVVIFNRDTKQETALNYVMVASKDQDYKDVYQEMSVVYEDNFAKLTDIKTNDIAIIDLGVIPRLYFFTGTGPEIPRDVYSSLTDDPNTLFIWDGSWSTIQFDITQKEFVSSPSPKREAYKLELKTKAEKYQFENIIFTPSALTDKQRHYYSVICKDPKLKGLYPGGSAEDIYRVYGNPNNVQWMLGSKQLIYENAIFFANILDNLPMDPKESVRLDVSNTLWYWGDYKVGGIKKGMDLQEIAKVLGFVPELEFSWDSEVWVISFSQVLHGFDITYSFSSDMTIDFMTISLYDETEYKKQALPNPMKISTYPASQNDFEFPLKGIEPLSKFKSIDNQFLLYNDDGFFIYEPRMLRPHKIGTQNMRYIDQSQYGFQPCLYAIGEDDHILYRILLDSWELIPLTASLE